MCRDCSSEERYPAFLSRADLLERVGLLGVEAVATILLVRAVIRRQELAADPGLLTLSDLEIALLIAEPRPNPEPRPSTSKAREA